MRFDEGCSLEWDEIDPSGLCLRLHDSKTGRSTRPLSTAAAEVIASIAKNRSRWLFPNKANLAPADLKKSVAALFDKAELHDARSQVLRRTFASVAADEGYSDATIAELIGHARQGVTARHYIRLPDAALLEAANRVASRIGKSLDGKLSEATILNLRRARSNSV
jgi:integrase